MWFLWLSEVFAADPTVVSLRRVETQAQALEITTAAVEAAANQMPWVVRPVARTKLQQVAFACPAYDFRWDAAEFRVQCVDSKPFTWKVGQQGTWVDDRGVAHPVSFTRTGDRFELTLGGDDGTKSWIYDFRLPGSMTLTQTVASSYLTAPMRWVLHYRTE
jgi:hypothetical protein